MDLAPIPDYNVEPEILRVWKAYTTAALVIVECYANRHRAAEGEWEQAEIMDDFVRALEALLYAHVDRITAIMEALHELTMDSDSERSDDSASDEGE